MPGVLPRSPRGVLPSGHQVLGMRIIRGIVIRMEPSTCSLGSCRSNTERQPERGGRLVVRRWAAREAENDTAPAQSGS